jgi:hypothetical protein
VIHLESGRTALTVAPERGGEIRFIGEPGGQNLLAYDNFLTPAPASTSGSYGSSELDWLSAYRGGWQGLFPNAGPECTVAGIPLPFHGEISTASFEVLEQGRDFVLMRAPARLPIVFERRIEIDKQKPVVRIVETITNESATSVPFLWGHHPAFRARSGTYIDIPATRVVVDSTWVPELADLTVGAEGTWPYAPGDRNPRIRIDELDGTAAERLCYLPDLPETWAAIRHPATRAGIGIAWQKNTFPHAWLWVQIGGSDFPWFGRSNIVAIEPHSSWPQSGLAIAESEGRANRLDGGASLSTSLIVVLFAATATPVRRITMAGDIQLSEGAVDGRL